ncbi:MAG: hypothetical protein QM778_37735 [Myxococcales bacterium]
MKASSKIFWKRADDQATHSLTFTITALPAIKAGMVGPRMFCSG